MTDSEKISALEETVADMKLESLAHQVIIKGLIGCLGAFHGEAAKDAFLEGLTSAEGPELSNFDDPEEANRRIQLLKDKLSEFK